MAGVTPEELDRFAGEATLGDLRGELAITRLTLERVMNEDMPILRKASTVIELVRTIERLVVTISMHRGVSA